VTCLAIFEGNVDAHDTVAVNGKVEAFDAHGVR
jgi:hypothetical protein